MIGPRFIDNFSKRLKITRRTGTGDLRHICGTLFTEKETAMADFFAFRRMLFPILIQVVFWLGTAAMFIIGGWTIYGAKSEDFSGFVDTTEWDRLRVAAGVAIIIVGPLVLRLWAELIILGFRINETLTDIRNELKNSRQGVSVQQPRATPPSA
jgi:hypothetical protein